MDNQQVKNFIVSARQKGIPDDQILAFVKQKTAPTQPEEGFVAKASGTVADAFTGSTQAFGNTIGQVIAAPKNTADFTAAAKESSDLQLALTKRIQENKKIGQDTSKLESTLKALVDSHPQLGQYTGVEDITNKQVIGQAIGTALEATSGGLLEGGVKNVASKSASLLEKIKAGAKVGSAYGATGGLSQGLQQNKDAMGIVGDVATGAVIGGALGGGLPAVGTVASAGTKQASKAVGEVVSGVKSAASKAGSSISPITESVGSTIGGAIRRGKDAVVSSVEEAQRVSKLPVAEKAAVRSGLDTGVIDFVKTTSKENIPVYQKIVAAAKNGANNLRGGTKAKEVVGKLIVDNVVKPAIKLRNTVGKKLGAIVDILPVVPENVSTLRDEFSKVLESVGVRVGNKGKLITTRGGVKGDLSAYQNMWDRIKSGYASQREIHDIRSAIFKEFELAGARQAPFSSQADNVAEQFRSILGKGISNKKYLELSKQYSETINPLRDFVKYIGYKGDIAKLGTQNLRVAEIAQRVLGNASARPQEVIDALTKLADKAGKGKLSKDITDAIRFSDLIEEFYGLQQTRSLGGQVARGTKAGVEGATNSAIEGAANGGITGMIGGAVKGVLGKTTVEQQKALDELLFSLMKKSK